MSLFRRRAPDPDEMTPARRERLTILGAAGDPEMPRRAYVETHLMFIRTLVDDGKLGGKDDHER